MNEILLGKSKINKRVIQRNHAYLLTVCAKCLSLFEAVGLNMAKILCSNFGNSAIFYWNAHVWQIRRYWNPCSFANELKSVQFFYEHTYLVERVLLLCRFKTSISSLKNSWDARRP